MPFKTLQLADPLCRAVETAGYARPTEIQAKAIPHVLDGKDLLGCAQTGTGKTAAFALPILQRLAESAPKPKRPRKGQKAVPRPIRALVLSPTRELAAQIGESFGTYGQHTGLRHTVIYGGVKQHRQVNALQGGVDILVATPGRLLDLMGQGLIALGRVEAFVLDEADRMLDMGFIHDIRKVVTRLPEKRQTLLFSATMPKEIRELAGTLLDEPVSVAVKPEAPAAETVDQTLYYVDRDTKLALLQHLLGNPNITRALVFTRTKYGADKVARKLNRAHISAEAIHSNKSQNARQKALGRFKEGQTRVLVASDIIARGLDVDEISHVFNYDLPHEPETYVHRIGRTGRAGANGRAISFCDELQRKELKGIERLLGKTIPVKKHNVKAPDPVQPQRGRGQGKGKGANHTRGSKTATPEQQQTDFWKSRKKPNAQPAGKPKRNAKAKRPGRGQAAAAQPEGKPQGAGKARAKRRRRRKLK